MKKIVALGAAAALVGGLFAAEPASNPSVVEFTGNASVEWGVDLDAGKTGFKNDTSASFKMKLFDTGTKETSSDGDIWAELKIKIEDDDSVGPNGVNNGTPKWKAAAVDTAKLHFYKFYVGIQSGDTQVGELDFLTAVRSADPWFHPGRWMKAIGGTQWVGKDAEKKNSDGTFKDVEKQFTQGIVAGYDDTNLNIGVDFRSLDNGQYTNSYAIAAEAKLKDSNELVEGLSVGFGVGYTLSDKNYYSKAAAAATAYHYADVDADSDPNSDAVWMIDGVKENQVLENEKLGHTFAYSAGVGYKLKIDDKLWLKPQVGFEGLTYTSDYDGVKFVSNGNALAAGLMFGWGDNNSYGNTGTLYYFDDDWGDKAKGLTPGLSAVVYIPLPATETTTASGGSYKATYHSAMKALIVPSLYSGDLVENLKFAAYSEIGLFEYKDPADRYKGPTAPTTNVEEEYWDVTADGKNTMALALAAGIKYDIKADDITVTPKASVRYANSCYAANKKSIDGVVPASDKTMFPIADLGTQKLEDDGERAGLLAGDFFNLTAGVEVAGLINNTTFYGLYKSANLLNKTDYSSETINGVANPSYSKFGMYNVKLGTFNVGCKISF